MSRTFPFGKGRPRKSRPLVENTPRVASPPHRGLAREEVTLLVDGAPQTLEIVRQDRIHGQEAYWVCSRCGELRWHLYVHNNEIACRVCLGLSYACKRHHNAVVNRARKLRRKLGGSGKLLTALPPRPRHWRRDHYARAIAKLVAVEAALAARLRDMVGRRRKRA
jgi:hypothetical protein